MALINYNNVNIYQDSQQVLKNVNFTVDEGEFIYLTGKVGSGKSTLLKTIYAELPVKEGNASVLGFDLKTLKQKNVPELRRKLGIIFQDFQLLTDRTVEANLRFVLKATGWKKKSDMDRRIKDVLELVGMSTKGYKMPYELSGGEQQRISIARAILNKPQLILADEPTGNLDVETSNNITELLKNISKAGSTVIMITHNMNLLNRFPGKVYKCEEHEFTEVTTPVFDLSSLGDDEEDIEISRITEGNKSVSATEDEPCPVREAEDTESAAEAIAGENTGEKSEIDAGEDSGEKTTQAFLQPIVLDEIEPSDVTAINDIIREHETKNEVVD